MLPLLNWTSYFISVGRSKGRDHFIFITIPINLPPELFMYPKGIVDSDEYGPDDKLMHLTENEKRKRKNPTLSFPFSVPHVQSVFGMVLSWSTSL